MAKLLVDSEFQAKDYTPAESKELLTDNTVLTSLATSIVNKEFDHRLDQKTHAELTTKLKGSKAGVCNAS